MQRLPIRRLFHLSIILTTAIMLFSMEPADASVYNLMKPVYHVYVDGENIGTVDNKDKLNETIDKLKQEEKGDGLVLSLENEVKVVPERLFRPSYDNNEAIKQLEDDLAFVAEGYELSLGKEKVGIFASEKQAKNALWAYAKPFLSEDHIEKVERMTKNELPTGKKRYPADALEFSEAASIEKIDAAPQDVLTEGEGVSRLSKGYKEEYIHSVEEDETLEELAKKYEMTEEEVVELNDLSEDEELNKGDELQVLKEKPFGMVVETLQSVEDEAITHKTETKKSNSLLKGEREVTQTGKDGEKSVTYRITRENGRVVAKDVVEEEVMVEPVTEEITVGTKEISSKGTGSFEWPAVGGTITSKQGDRWGSFHKGIDIAGVSDKTISTVDNGTVKAAGKRSGYGNQVTISHNNGLETTYSHLASISVSVGDTVQKGSKIGMMGTTGKSTGIHLHFEVYKNGELQNPMKYL
ncbi:peptidoglycan DD-metalloendopeptidase family protein [Pseudalkalibacillus hwajinpoensis]|uniref:peptidoglycan DD-metalloendopeptidase family protein n=1 Tax=Guptibacillus hwajinpoensis TaxID=208199 RepID=UPI00325BA277